MTEREPDREPKPSTSAPHDRPRAEARQVEPRRGGEPVLLGDVLDQALARIGARLPKRPRG